MKLEDFMTGGVSGEIVFLNKYKTDVFFKPITRDNVIPRLASIVIAPFLFVLAVLFCIVTMVLSVISLIIDKFFNTSLYEKFVSDDDSFSELVFEFATCVFAIVASPLINLVDFIGGAVNSVKESLPCFSM